MPEFQTRSIPKSEQKKPFYKKKSLYIWGGLVGLFSIFIVWLAVLLSPLPGVFGNLPTLLGFFGEKHYLLIVQNNAERRPTGGFISAYAKISFFLGIPSITLKDSYDIAPPNPQIDPPYPLNTILAKDIFYKGFVFRDANWNPNFEESAKTLESMYLESSEKGDYLDGVIAIDLSMLEFFIREIGSVGITGDVFDASTIFHKMQFYSKNIDLHSEEALKSRKNIMGELLPAILKRMALSPFSYADYIRLIEQGLEEKHIQMIFHDESLSLMAKNNQWYQMLTPKAPDFFHVNRANIGGRKADRYIIPEYRYEVSFDDNGQGHANLQVSYHYNASQGLYTDFYQAYVRVYIPEKVMNLKSFGDNALPFTHAEESQGLQSAGTLIKLWPGETKSLYFSYDLPEDIHASAYALDIIPQAGSTGEDVDITLRNKNTDTFFTSQDFQVQEHTARFRGTLRQEVLLTASTLKDTTAPVIVSQKFIDGKNIQILFSERLKDSVLVPENFILQSADLKQKKAISSVIQNNDSYMLFLKTEEIPWQTGSKWILTMNNIADTAGNLSVPHPKIVTLVQR